MSLSSWKKILNEVILCLFGLVRGGANGGDFERELVGLVTKTNHRKLFKAYGTVKITLNTSIRELSDSWIRRARFHFARFRVSLVQASVFEFSVTHAARLQDT